MALPELGRHPVLRVYRVQLRVRDIIFFDLEAILSQVTYPRRAAPSGRAFIRDDAGTGRSLLRQGKSQQYHTKQRDTDGGQ